ncbi:MAG: Zn-ribbon domain-containing OB-fold protein [Halobacteriota archaeon]
MKNMGAPRFWRNINQRYRAVGTECETCDTAYFPPRKLCPRCRRSGEIVEREMSGRGEVVSYTVVHEPGADYEGEVPYVLAVVELEEGPRVTAQVVDDVEVGDEVSAVFRRIGEAGDEGMLHYGTKFEAVD